MKFPESEARISVERVGTLPAGCVEVDSIVPPPDLLPATAEPEVESEEAALEGVAEKIEPGVK